ncbi:MAG: hypothetical protein AB1649_00670 [Chloroflexota bacterium]
MPTFREYAAEWLLSPAAKDGHPARKSHWASKKTASLDDRFSQVQSIGKADEGRKIWPTEMASLVLTSWVVVVRHA